ncbi:MAG: hypothetical protein ACREEM_40930 [Blastocatellia bacterium]
MGFWTVARLKAGVAFEQAKAEMAMISQRLAATDPTHYQGVEANPVLVLKTWVAQIRGSLLLLFGAVALVLLIPPAGKSLPRTIASWSGCGGFRASSRSV